MPTRAVKLTLASGANTGLRAPTPVFVNPDQVVTVSAQANTDQTSVGARTAVTFVGGAFVVLGSAEAVAEALWPPPAPPRPTPAPPRDHDRDNLEHIPF